MFRSIRIRDGDSAWHFESQRRSKLHICWSEERSGLASQWLVGRFESFDWVLANKSFFVCSSGVLLKFETTVWTLHEPYRISLLRSDCVQLSVDPKFWVKTPSQIEPLNVHLDSHIEKHSDFIARRRVVPNLHSAQERVASPLPDKHLCWMFSIRDAHQPLRKDLKRSLSLKFRV